MMKLLQTDHKAISRKQATALRGISLVELLVVVALLMLILIALFRVFGTDIGKARDAQRKKDLQQIKRAYEDYYNDHDAYPPSNALEDCNGDSLAPYLKKIPCDPITGDPYLYLPLDNGLGYRVLSQLSNLNDPIIKELNCVGGCGVPSDSPAFDQADRYVYGVSEGTPVSTNEEVPDVPDDENYCQTHECYCCLQANMDCMLWLGSGACGTGPFTSISECYAASSCRPN